MVGRVIKDRNDKWYDGKFVHHTLASLDCYPVYMQVCGPFLACFGQFSLHFV